MEEKYMWLFGENLLDKIAKEKGEEITNSLLNRFNANQFDDLTESEKVILLDDLLLIDEDG